MKSMFSEFDLNNFLENLELTIEHGKYPLNTSVLLKFLVRIFTYLQCIRHLEFVM